MPRLSAEAPFLHPDCEVTATDFGAFVEIGKGSRIAHSTVGNYSYCDRYADIANTTIGKFANIASFVRIGATDHPLHTASCHHFLYRSELYWDDIKDDADFFERRRARRAHIGHDTWIGHRAMVKPEVNVGDGAVIAAGAIVTKDVAPYSIVAGAPAKLMRLRQPPEIAARLSALAWWDWDHDRLRDALLDFRAMHAEAFLEKYGG